MTPIINPPGSAILAVGPCARWPAADDKIRIGRRMNVTLIPDHQMIDGALAAQFLKEVRRLLKNPAALFGQRSARAPSAL